MKGGSYGVRGGKCELRTGIWENAGHLWLACLPTGIFAMAFQINSYLAIVIIEKTSKEIIFRIPKSVKVDDLQDLADLFEYTELSKKSKASQKDVDDLVRLVKKGRWAKTKQRLG